MIRLSRHGFWRFGPVYLDPRPWSLFVGVAGLGGIGAKFTPLAFVTLSERDGIAVRRQHRRRVGPFIFTLADWRTA